MSQPPPQMTEEQRAHFVGQIKAMLSADDREEFLARNPSFRELLKEGPSLTHQQMILLTEYQRLSSYGGEESFLETDQIFAQLRDEQAWKKHLARLWDQYDALDSAQARAHFLHSNPLFVEQMQTSSALSDAQRAELKRLAKAAANPAEFGLVNPMLSDSTPVLRGADVVIEEEVDLQGLDAIATPNETDNPMLVAIDYTDDDLKARRERNRNSLSTTDDIQEKPPSWWQKISADQYTWAVSALIFGAVLFMGHYFVAKASGAADSAEDIEAIFGDIVHASLKGDVPSVHGDVYTEFVTQQQEAASHASIGGTTGGSIRMAIRVHLQTVERLMSEGKFVQAASLCRDIVAKDPKNSQVRMTLIKALLQMKNWDEAMANCIAGLKLCSTIEEAHMFEALIKQIGGGHK